MPGEWDIPKRVPEPDPEYDDAELEEEFGPGDPDYDLSESHGYSWEPRREHWPVPPWLLIAISILVVIALVFPAIALILR
jgi:hypothetical protein